MSLTVWTQPSGTSLGTFPGEVSVDLALPVINASGVAFYIISGALPKGLFLKGTHIVGSPFTVGNQTDYKFCIRASDNGQISDRTFTIKVTDTNFPVFVQPPGLLDIGPAHQMYVLDGTYVEYQIEVVEFNAEGRTLKFSIDNRGGELPPGLTLSDSGVISGYVQPTPVILPTDGSGAYDKSIFDNKGYDYASVPTDGYSDYSYDSITFDYSVPTQQQITLNVNYQFRVTVTDGFSVAQRVFRIFVVGDDEFRADSTTFNGLADEFTADSTYIRQPVWITKSNLGVFRANNYLTVPIALYDPLNVIFRLETTNQEIYANTFAVTNRDNISGSSYLTITNVSIKTAGTVLASGLYLNFEYYLDGADGTTYQIAAVDDLGNGVYRLTLATPLAQNMPNGTAFFIGSLCTLPTGVNFDPGTGDIYGLIPYQPTITKNYQFTLTASRTGNKGDTVSSSRTFNLTIIGDLNSIITWQTPSDLGTVNANYTVTLSLLATSNIADSVVIYTMSDADTAKLDRVGLSLNVDGELIGTINQFYNPTTGKKGLITFDNGTTFDNNTTTFDRTFIFTVTASDQYYYNQTTRTFKVSIATPNTVNYSNIVAKPFLIASQRTTWHSFINNPNIFTPSTIYRSNDPEFGVQTNLQMLIYAGIETKESAVYISAIGLNNKRKRFLFGDVKKAVAIDPVTGTSVYEAIYIQMLDPLEPDGKHLPNKIKFDSLNPDVITADETHLTSRPFDQLTVDSTGYEASNPHIDTYFPNSITNWRDRIENWTDNNGNSLAHERNYLPLWMRSIPAGSKSQLDYVLAIPLCFCKPGQGDTILRNIANSKFDFTQINYEIDRYIINQVTGYYSDKYLVFKDDRITV
jgi:hypothetical protein